MMVQQKSTVRLAPIWMRAPLLCSALLNGCVFVCVCVYMCMCMWRELPLNDPGSAPALMICKRYYTPYLIFAEVPLSKFPKFLSKILLFFVLFLLLLFWGFFLELRFRFNV